MKTGVRCERAWGVGGSVAGAGRASSCAPREGRGGWGVVRVTSAARPGPPHPSGPGPSGFSSLPTPSPLQATLRRIFPVGFLGGAVPGSALHRQSPGASPRPGLTALSPAGGSPRSTARRGPAAAPERARRGGPGSARALRGRAGAPPGGGNKRRQRLARLGSAGAGGGAGPPGRGGRGTGWGAGPGRLRAGPHAPRPPPARSPHVGAA